MDAGNYTVVLINKITKEEHRRSFQLLVNGEFSSGLSSEIKERKVFLCPGVHFSVFSTVAPRIIEKEVAPDTDVYPFGSSPTLRCTARGFPTPSHIEWQWMSKGDCPEAFQ